MTPLRMRINRRLVRDLAKQLGWPEPEFWDHEFEEEEIKRCGLDIQNNVWAECHVQPNFFVQINTHPRIEEEHSMCVYAIRYRICSGWRKVLLYPDARRRREEIARVAPYFHYQHFATAESRREYRQQYPFARDFTWKRISSEGAPHF